MNIYNTSEHAGVFIATVSRTLNDNVNVSERTREKILKAMNDLGYIPNTFARGLDLNTMWATGVMCSDSSDLHLANVIYYPGWRLRSYSYGAVSCCTGYDLGAKQKYFGLLCFKCVDIVTLTGFGFVEVCSEDNVYTIEAAIDLPITLVDGCLEKDNIYSTVCDNHTVTFGVATQPLQTGRRRTLYLYTSYSCSGVNKLKGYRDALKAFGVESKNELIRQCPKDIGASRELLLSLRKQGFSFDAVTISDDFLTAGTVRYAHEAGISIPEGLDIAGHNNSILSRCTDPKITSIDSKVETLCITTIDTLMGIFSGINVSNRTTAASDLIKRKTINFQLLRRAIKHESIFGQRFLTIQRHGRDTVSQFCNKYTDS